MSRFKAVTKFGGHAFIKSKAAVAAAAGSLVALAGSASATPAPTSLIDWDDVTTNIRGSLADPASQAVIIGGLILAAFLGWMMIKRFAK